MGYEYYTSIFAPFLSAFPDFHWELGSLVAGDDPIFFTIRNGLIAECRFYEDASFVTQLGIDVASIRLNT